MIKFHHFGNILLVLLILYFIYLFIQYYQFEHFASIQLTPVITENRYDPPIKGEDYSYQINKNYCFGNLFCPNKNDLCINNHCVSGGVPPESYFINSCQDCPKPGLIP